MSTQQSTILQGFASITPDDLLWMDATQWIYKVALMITVTPHLACRRVYLTHVS